MKLSVYLSIRKHSKIKDEGNIIKQLWNIVKHAEGEESGCICCLSATSPSITMFSSITQQQHSNNSTFQKQSKYIVRHSVCHIAGNQETGGYSAGSNDNE